MSKQLQNFAAVATILVALGTVSGWLISGYGLPLGSTATSQPGRFLPTTLIVSGSGVNLKIRKGASSSPYPGGEISSSGAEQVIYLPVGQPLLLQVSGSGANIAIQSAVAPFVRVNSSGSNTDVYDL